MSNLNQSCTITSPLLFSHVVSYLYLPLRIYFSSRWLLPSIAAFFLVFSLASLQQMPTVLLLNPSFLSLFISTASHIPFDLRYLFLLIIAFFLVLSPSSLQHMSWYCVHRIAFPPIFLVFLCIYHFSHSFSSPLFVSFDYCISSCFLALIVQQRFIVSCLTPSRTIISVPLLCSRVVFYLYLSLFVFTGWLFPLHYAIFLRFLSLSSL